MWGQNATLEATEEDINDETGEKDRDACLKKKRNLQLLHHDSIFSTRAPSHAHLCLLLLSFPVSSSAEETQKNSTFVTLSSSAGRPMLCFLGSKKERGKRDFLMTIASQSLRPQRIPESYFRSNGVVIAAALLLFGSDVLFKSSCSRIASMQSGDVGLFI